MPQVDLLSMRWLLFFAFVVAAASFTLASSRSLVLDEAVTMMHSYAGLHGRWLELFSDIHMPIYNVLVAGWMQVFGFDAVSGKALSIVFAVGALALTFVLADRNFGRRAAILSSLLLSFSPLFISYAQLVRSYALFIALAAASSYAYLEWSRSGFELRSRKAAIYLVSTLFLLFSHMVAVSVVVVQGLHVLWTCRRARSLASFSRWAAIATLVAVGYAPVVWTIFHRYDVAKSVPIIYSWVKSPDVWDLVQSVGYSFVDPIGFTLFFSLFIVIAIWRRAEKSDVVVYLALWLAVPSLILFVTSHVFHPVFIRRGLAPSIVPLVLLTAYGIDRSKRLVTIGIAATVVVCALGADELRERTTMQDEDWRSVGEIIRADAKDSSVFLRPGYGWPALLYYLDRECFLSQNPESCLKQRSIALVGAPTLENAGRFSGVNWYVAYQVEDEGHRAVLDGVRNDQRFSEIKEFPEVRGVGLYRFEFKTRAP